MMNEKQCDRRKFLKKLAGASGALIAPYFAPASVLGAEGRPAPSDRITMGVIGIGKMGQGDLGMALGHPDMQILAVCDVWKNRREGAKTRVENWYAAKKKGSYRGCAAYNDFRKIIERDDIDSVMIVTPPHWHAVMAVAAAKAGKDIFIEKPLGRTILEARAIANAAVRYQRVLQTNSWQRSQYKFRFACEMVRSGRIGRVLRVHVNVGGPSVDCYLPPEPTPEGLDWDMWLGPAPKRPYNSIICPPSRASGWPQWRHYRDYDGGGMTDIGAHHFDIAQWGLGMDHTGPVEITPPDGKKVKLLTYRYANGVLMYHGGGTRGIDFIGEKGRITVDRGYLDTDPKSLMKEPIRPDEVHLYRSDNHFQNWVDCVRSRRLPICCAEIGCRSVTVCHLGNIAYWLGRPLKWDPSKEEFIGDEEANRMRLDAMRSPWRV